jgi:hypothetical protein
LKRQNGIKIKASILNRGFVEIEIIRRNYRPLAAAARGVSKACLTTFSPLQQSEHSLVLAEVATANAFIGLACVEVFAEQQEA